MGWTGHCVKGEHDACPDSKEDTYMCDCPHHLGMVKTENTLPGVLVFAGFVRGKGDELMIRRSRKPGTWRTDYWVVYMNGQWVAGYDTPDEAYDHLTRWDVPWGEGPTLESSMGG